MNIYKHILVALHDMVPLLNLHQHLVDHSYDIIPKIGTTQLFLFTSILY